MKELLNDYVQNLDTYIMFKIKQQMLELTPELTSKGRAPVNLSMGAPATPPPDFVYEKLLESLHMPMFHSYTTPKGENFLIEAIAERMKRRFGVDLNPKTEIFSLIGSKEGIANFIRLIINPTTVEKDKDIIMVPDPGYASYSQMIKVSGGLGYSIPLLKENNYMPDMEKVLADLEKEGLNPKKVKAVVLNYPNNPLGAVATREYLKSVVDFCRKHNIILISDAAYVDMTFPGQEKCASIFEFEGAKDIAIEFHSFSKPYAMTGWRVGWCCGNETLVSFLGKLKSTIDTGVFKPIQYAAAKVLNSKEGDDYIIWSNCQYEKKQKIILDGFSELGWDIEAINPPKATFYLWLPIPKKYTSSVDFSQDALKKSGVVLVPGVAFGKYGEGSVRMSIVDSEEKMHEVVSRFKKDGFYFDR
ncbi:aminotransferase class I/II-fold pyridoxal phosphate-dependent enzyme [bacterium]|nr:aminotransferase class I/II-fold pyridoxal phosphate-dependent enzyme [bacterium]